MRWTLWPPWVRASLRLPGLLAGYLVRSHGSFGARAVLVPLDVVPLDAGATTGSTPPVPLDTGTALPVPAGTGLRIDPLGDRLGVRVTGEVDLCTRARWASALDQAAEQAAGRDFDVHIDLSALTFTDATGVALLVAATERVSRGRRIVVHRPPRGWLLIFELFWPEGVPVVEVVDDERRS